MVGHQNRPATSEYRRSYRESKFNSSSQIYEDNLDFRTHRRLAEFNHNVDVFTWNEPSWDSESSSSGENQKRSASTPIHKLKHEKFNDNYRKNQLNKTKEIKVSTTPNLQSSVTVNIDGRQTPSPCQKNEVPPVTDEKGTQKEDVKDKSQQTSDTEGSSKSTSPTPDQEQWRKSSIRPKKPGQTFVYKKFVPKPKTFPTALGRSLKKQDQGKEEKPKISAKAPFVAYGYKDQEVATAVKRTHNVKASQEVYPSALRALQRRQAQIERQDQNLKSAPLREKRKKALFNDFDTWMKRETSAWDTEYRRHFVGYDSKTYEQNVSARMHPARFYAGERLLATA